MLSGKLAYTVQSIHRIVYTSIVFDPNVPKFTLVYDCHHFHHFHLCFCQVNNHIYILKNNNAIDCFMIILFVIAIAEFPVNYINYNQLKQDKEFACFRGFYNQSI